MENNRGEAMKNYLMIFSVMMVSLAIASFWGKIPLIKNSVHYVLDPSFGSLLNWNITLGMFVIVAIISLITTIVQKYTTDQEALRQIKKEQKAIQEEMKKFQHDPAKVLELNKKSLELIPKTMHLSMRSIIYTSLPFILLFRWFYDYFAVVGNPTFLGIFSWYWFYLFFVIVFGMIFKKVLKAE